MLTDEKTYRELVEKVGEEEAKKMMERVWKELPRMRAMSPEDLRENYECGLSPLARAKESVLDTQGTHEKRKSMTLEEAKELAKRFCKELDEMGSRRDESENPQLLIVQHIGMRRNPPTEDKENSLP